jgi:hypothetical protein
MPFNEEELRRSVTERLLARYPKLRDDPSFHATVERALQQALDQNPREFMSGYVARIQDNIETRLAKSAEGLDLNSIRPQIIWENTGQFTAMSAIVPGNPPGYLVWLHNDLQVFSRRLSRLMAEALPGQDEGPRIDIDLWSSAEAVGRRLDSMPALVADFSDLVTRYVITGNAARVTTRRHLSSAREQIATNLDLAQEYFVLGHEYAHIVTGHLGQEETVKGLLTLRQGGEEIRVGGAGIEQLTFSWAQELLADFLGMTIGIGALVDSEEADLFWGFAGIDLYFGAMDVMDRAVAVLEAGEEQALQLGLHPPPLIRRQRLWTTVPILDPRPESEPVMADTQQMADLQSMILAQLWQRTRPVLLELRYQEQRAHEQWRVVEKDQGTGLMAELGDLAPDLHWRSTYQRSKPRWRKSFRRR